MVQPVIRRFDDHDALSEAAAAHIAEALTRAVEDRGEAAIALAGGSTPRQTYEILGEAHVEDVPWDSVHVFWGDERCVPPDDEDSNQAMARKALLDLLHLPEEHIHAMPGDVEPPTKAAEAYEAQMRTVLGARAGADAPLLDVVLLGLGGDGHTASLFPGDAALDVDDRWVAAARAPEGASVRDRLTLTFPAIAASELVMFIVSGESKRGVVGAIVEGRPAASGYPAARVTARGAVEWFVDEAAYPSS